LLQKAVDFITRAGIQVRLAQYRHRSVTFFGLPTPDFSDPFIAMLRHPAVTTPG